MKKDNFTLGNLVDEYREIVADVALSKTSDDECDWVKLENKLQVKAEWTKNGAQHLLSLVRNYGSFILQNALALAIAADIEDGALKL